MRKNFLLSYLLIFVVLFFSLSLSKTSSERLRRESVSIFAPLWERIYELKFFVNHPLNPHQSFGKLSSKEKLQKLELENELLKIKLTYFEDLIKDPTQIHALATGSDSFFNNKIQMVPAQIIFRSFDQWNSCAWINVGEKNNEQAGRLLIAQKSPVLVGKTVVGMIDYVGKNQSRVRLITDPSITPSVRAVRGGKYEELMIESIDHLLKHLSTSIIQNTSSDHLQLDQLLQELKMTLRPQKKTWYLAKGELQGSINPLGYAPPILKGTGFNYDFADDKGASRDLRTGEAEPNSKEKTLPILKVNDILITTGMDGIFPADLPVAIVTKINYLKEGDYFYDLEAKPLAANLEELSLVFVIPPINEYEEFTVK